MKRFWECLLTALAAAAVIWLLARRDGGWADETQGCRIHEDME